MEQELFLSVLAILVNKTDSVNTDNDNSEESQLPF